MRMTCKAVCLVALFTAGCSSSAGPTFDSADQDRIKAVIQQLTEAFNAKDAAKAAALYTSEAVVMPPNKTLMRGRNFVEQYYTARFGEGASQTRSKAREHWRWPWATTGWCWRRRRDHRAATAASSSGSSAS